MELLKRFYEDEDAMRTVQPAMLIAPSPCAAARGTKEQSDIMIRNEDLGGCAA